MTELPPDPTEYADAEGVLYRISAREQVVIDCRRRTLVLGPNQARALGEALLRWAAATATPAGEAAERWIAATGDAGWVDREQPPSDLEQVYRELGDVLGRLRRAALGR